MKKTVLFLLTACGMLSLGTTSFAQHTNYVTPDTKMMAGSGTASGLSNIASPGLFNGSMNIGIPIYSFSHNKMQLGVSLAYNTKGVAVDETSAQAGLHWNIQTLPTITRVVKDLPDEFYFSCPTSDSVFAISFDQDTILNHEMYVKGKLLTYTETQQQQQADNIYRDKASDEFAVSLGGTSFTFYIGNDFKIYTVPHKDIKVQILANGAPVNDLHPYPSQASLSFQITDEEGNKFIFTPAESEYIGIMGPFLDWAESGFQQSFSDDLNIYANVVWKIKTIVFSDGEKISYDYTYSQTPYNFKASRSYYANESSGSSQFLGQQDAAGPSGDTYISQINYPDGSKVSFIYDSLNNINDTVYKTNELNEPMLSEIAVSSGGNCRRFRFYQGKSNGRWYLDSITQLSCDSSKEEPYYAFTYNPILKISEITLPYQNPIFDTEFSSLPNRLSSAQDLYGYYNGDSSGTALGTSTTDISIPKHDPPAGPNYGSEREYNATYAQAGLLTSVRNAYGGVEHFYYGPNVISTVPLSNIIPTDSDFIGADQPDGVRIDSIVKTDSSKPGYKFITTFQYYEGQLFMPGGYFDYPNYADSASGNWNVKTFQNYFLTPHEMINGANHGYDTVIVTNYTGNQQLSRTVYTFTNMEDATSNGQPRYYHVSGSKDYFEYPYTDKQYLKDWAIGLPLTVTQYDQNDKILSATVNDYNFSDIDLSAASYINNAKTVKANSGEQKGVLDVGGDGYIPDIWQYYSYNKDYTDNYYPFSGKAQLAMTIKRKYVSDTRFIADTVWYDYDDHNNLISTITQNSKGQKTKTEVVYNYDVDGPTSVTGLSYSNPGTTLYNMTDSGLEEVVSTERWRLNPQMVGGEQLLSAYITKYQYQNGKLRTEGLLNTDIGNPVPFTGYAGNPVNYIYVNRYNRILSAYNTSDSVADFIKTSAVTLFDSEGNPLESQLLNQDQYKAMIWDTTTGQKLAEAANCRYSDIAYTSFEDSLKEGNLTCSNQAEIISSGGAITGTHVGLLWTQTTPGVAITLNGTQNLDTGKAYILSFWVFGTPPQIEVGSQSVPVTSASLVYTKGSWSNYQIRFVPSVVGKLAITGVAPFSLIDEIRLYPAGTQMQSWTYDPLFGKSSYTDPSGRVTYYRYDKMGRQNMVLDQDGNILSKTDYHVAH